MMQMSQSISSAQEKQSTVDSLRGEIQSLRLERNALRQEVQMQKKMECQAQADACREAGSSGQGEESVSQAPMTPVTKKGLYSNHKTAALTVSPIRIDPIARRLPVEPIAIDDIISSTTPTVPTTPSASKLPQPEISTPGPSATQTKPRGAGKRTGLDACSGFAWNSSLF